MVWDRSKEACQSWQDISFPRRPVVFIRIVGTHNTANEVFHCVHFECPAVTNVVKPNPVEAGEEGVEGGDGSKVKEDSVRTKQRHEWFSELEG